METRVELSIGEYPLKMSAAIPRIYRQFFNEDIITGMNSMQQRLITMPIEEREFTENETEMLEKLTHTCARHADPAQPEDAIEWLSQFEMSDVDKLYAATIKLWNEDNRQLSTTKKKTDEP